MNLLKMIFCALCISLSAYAGEDSGGGFSFSPDTIRILVSKTEAQDLFQNYQTIENIELPDGVQATPKIRFETLDGLKGVLAVDADGKLVQIVEKKEEQLENQPPPAEQP